MSAPRIMILLLLLLLLFVSLISFILSWSVSLLRNFLLNFIENVHCAAGCWYAWCCCYFLNKLITHDLVAWEKNSTGIRVLLFIDCCSAGGGHKIFECVTHAKINGKIVKNTKRFLFVSHIERSNIVLISSFAFVVICFSGILHKRGKKRRRKKNNKIFQPFVTIISFCCVCVCVRVSNGQQTAKNINCSKFLKLK